MRGGFVLGAKRRSNRRRSTYLARDPCSGLLRCARNDKCASTLLSTTTTMRNKLSENYPSTRPAPTIRCSDPTAFKLGVFSANCGGGLTMSLAPERWCADWDDIVAMTRIAWRSGAASRARPTSTAALPHTGDHRLGRGIGDQHGLECGADGCCRSRLRRPPGSAARRVQYRTRR
jgi:hypothetical protein